MDIIKNNGKIVIEEYNESNGFITSIKTIKAYNITVLDPVIAVIVANIKNKYLKKIA